MEIKYIVDEDYVNYKKCCMFIAMPYCSGKCWRELSLSPDICHNNKNKNQKNINVDTEVLIDRYLKNNISKSVCLGGFEPFDSFGELQFFVEKLRKKSLDDVVIYTGYYSNEITDKIHQLKKYKNIVIKFGRFIPNQKSIYDNILGVTLASDNQYAERIS